MIKFFKEMFSNSECTSSKRVLGAIGVLSMIVFMFLNPTSEIAVETVGYVTIAYGVGTVVEKFAKKDSNPEV
jgi:uncharacterized membrane protein HdeD (DUF308 family)